MKINKKTVEQFKKDAEAMQDYYFDKYMNGHDIEDMQKSAEYRGQETAYRMVLDLMREEN